MAGNGPPPNPNAIRRNLRTGVVVLPAQGRKGRTPTWPLPVDPKLTARVQLLEDEIELLEEREIDEGLSRTEKTKLSRTRERLAIAVAERDAIRDGEKKIWKELWQTPQACQWDKLRWFRGVALYARHQAAGEVGSLDDSREARQRADSLGLTPRGMKALMWVIAEDELAARRQDTATATGTDGTSSRRHIAAVEDLEP